MESTQRRRALGRMLADLGLALGAVAVATALGRGLGANPTAAALGLVLAVLAAAASRGLLSGLAAAVAATAAFNFFFLPPLHTFTVADPQNWVALAAFLVTAVVASRLLDRARRRAEEADARRREMETLYELSFALFSSGGGAEAPRQAALRTLTALGASGGALLVGPEPAGETLVAAWPEGFVPSAGEPGAAAPGLARVPLAIGSRTLGSLLARDCAASSELRESAGRLLAYALERERLLREAAELAALEESDRLKSSLLRAVSHDLRSPLTAIGLEIEAVRRAAIAAPALEPHLAALDLERLRLSRRIDNLLAAARLEAGVVRPHPEPMPAGELFASARTHLGPLVAQREVEVAVEADAPEAFVDPALALEMLVNLIENAVEASPMSSPLRLEARPGSPGRLALSVLDRGAGFVPDDSVRHGLGLLIVDSLARASGGRLGYELRPGGGTIARLELPAAP